MPEHSTHTAPVRAVIVDDEPLARERLRALLSEADVPVAVVAEAADGAEALQTIDATRPDVVFLDIGMPVLDGFDVVEMLPRPRPHIVFVTAYDAYAIRAFEVNALDYLTKPVRLGRLNTTLRRLADHHARRTAEHGVQQLLRTRAGAPLARLTFRAGRRLRVTSVADVRWFEAREKLVFAHASTGEHVVDFTLEELESRLDRHTFIRVHRSFIANAALVKEMTPWFAGRCLLRFDDGSEIPVARRRLSDVRRLLGG